MRRILVVVMVLLAMDWLVIRAAAQSPAYYYYPNSRYGYYANNPYYPQVRYYVAAQPSYYGNYGYYPQLYYTSPQPNYYRGYGSSPQYVQVPSAQPAPAASAGDASVRPPAIEEAPKAGPVLLPGPKNQTPPPLVGPPADFSLPRMNAGPDPGRFWARGEYLLWWVKNAPLPVPLVTTGDPNVGFPTTLSAGAIGQPGTQVLLGNSNVNFGAFSGMRFTLGGWRDSERVLGLEGGAFLLERRVNHFTAASDGNGNPPLYFPINAVNVGAERAIPISDPLRGFAGNVFIDSSLQLWGGEFNGLLAVCRRPGLEFSLMSGFRYMDLTESLRLHTTTTDLIFLNTTIANDQFATRNQFYGGQLGGRLSWQQAKWSLDLTGKVGLGVTHQVINVQGDTTQFALPGGAAPNPGMFPGGIFVQSTNSGRRTSNPFTVLPALEMKVAYQLAPWLRATVGYDVLYWNQVVRPGSQIDHNVNTTQNPVIGTGIFSGPASPAPLFNRADFWAQGVNFAIEFRY